MRKMISVFVVLVIGWGSILLSDSEPNKARYEPEKKDQVLEEIREKRQDLQKKLDEITGQIRRRQKEQNKKDEESERTLVSDTSGVFPPPSPKAFKQFFHFPPQAQYFTSTCWSFSATSYFESEIYRLTGKKIKLSEMWTPYFELIEKCRRFIQERGDSYVSGGGESNSVTRIWEKYGVVPAQAYSGLPEGQDKHDHVPMMIEIDAYLEYLQDHNLWDEDHNLKQITLILDKYMGKPPDTFSHEGKTFTPREFLKHTGLNMDDYCSVMSTRYFPFFTRNEFMVPDNWWHSRDYINLPLDLFYRTITNTINSGYTLIIGGDVSEPGKLGTNDIAFIPTFDIPGGYINQDSREYRIANGATQDDHGVHLVGYTRYRGHDWFLIKDSGRSARWGKYDGYYFFRGDFIKLKMLTFTVHKDMLSNILSKIK